MKVVSTEALTKLIQLVKSAFIKVDDVVEVTEIETETPSEITLAAVATSGSYNDLSNKPTIPAAQVNSDWNATSGKAQILNKPNLATVATSGSYNDLTNKPTIPTVNNATLTIQKNGTTVKTFTANASSNVTANITVPTKTSELTNDSGYTSNVGTVTKVNNTSPDSSGNVTLSIPAAQIQSDWTQTTTTAKDYIKNKPSLSTVATTGSYNDLTNKPTIPTVNNATLTIQKNGTTVKTFTANASSNVTANITVPTKTSDITNDSGYLTDISSSDVTTALGYTPYNSSNPNGYTSNVGTVTSVNNVSPVNGNVSLSIPTVPTNISAFNNDSGYITGINSTDVTTALGYTPTSPANVDGQWVFSSKSLHTSGAKGSTSFNLSSATYNNYLPSDNYCYEVLLSFYGANTSSTKAIAKFTFGGQETNAVAAINSGSMCTLNGIFPLDSTHTFTLAVTGKDFSTLNLDVLGYRRLGTNS